MAMNLDAILRVAARVTGREDVRGLGRDVHAAGRSAAGSAAGFNSMAASVGMLSRAATALGFAGVVAGLAAFGAKAIQAGEASNLLRGRVEAIAGPLNETAGVFAAADRAAKTFSIGTLEARQSMANLYATMRPLGLSLDQIETTMIGVTKAVRLAGLSGLDAKEAYRQLGQAIGSGSLQGDEFRSLMERIPMLGQKIVEVFNRLRSEGGLTLITRQQANEMVKEIKDGETRQTEVMKEGLRKRREALEESTDRELQRIARHYAKIRKIIADNNADQDTEEERVRSKREDAQREEIDAIYRERKKALDRDLEDQRQKISDDESLSEERKTALMRELQDAADERSRALDDQQEQEVDALRESNQRQATIRSRQLRDQREQEEEALSDRQRSAENAIRKQQEKAQRDEEAALEKSLAVNKAATEKMIAGVLARVEVTRGDLKNMAKESLITPSIVQMALDEMAKMKAPEPTALIKYNKAFSDLTASVGEKLLPTLTPLIEKITKLIGDPKFQQALGDLIKNINEVVVPLIKPLIEVLNGVLGTFAALPPGLREAIVKTAVLLGLLRALGAAGILGGLKRLADGFQSIINGAKGAGQAIKTVTVRDITAKGLPGGGPKMLPPVGGVPPIKPPPANMFAGFLAELAKVGRALGGLLREVGTFGALFLREIGLAIPGLGRLGQALAGLRIGATISGWLGALAPFAGRAILLMTPFLTWCTGTLLPALVGIFSGPVGWIALGAIALGTILIVWREPIWDFITWALGEIGNFWRTVGEIFYSIYFDPWVKLWNSDMLAPIRKGLEGWLNGIKKFFSDIIDFGRKNFIDHWKGLWELLTKDPEAFVMNIKGRFDNLVDSYVGAFKTASSVVYAIFQNTNSSISRVWSWIKTGIINSMNTVLEMYNNIVNVVNRVPGGLVRLPTANLIPQSPPIEAFARGGYMAQPTLGWLAEAGGDEYAIPGAQMPAAMAGWAKGLRGQALIEHSRSASASASASPAASLPGVRISLTQTGPTLVSPDGQEWISRSEALTLLQQSSQAQMAATVRLLQSGSGRSAWGLR